MLLDITLDKLPLACDELEVWWCWWLSMLALLTVLVIGSVAMAEEVVMYWCFPQWQNHTVQSHANRNLTEIA